jgi:mannose-6-phosphate isomerase-like protein (cupin superfamily)
VGEHAVKIARWDASAARFSPEKLSKVALFASERFFLDLYCLEPGQSQKPHAHTGSDKVYLVVEGRGEFEIGDEKRSLGPGEGTFAPSGVVHGVRNDSGARLVVLTWMSPPPGSSS